jgi:hypothetical protein
MVLDVNKSNNQLDVYDHILNARTVYIRTNGSLYTNEYGDEIIWRNSRFIDFRPKRWRNYVRLEVARNAEIVIGVNKRHRSITPPDVSLRRTIGEKITNISILEGTWQSQNPYKTLVLLATREGFKAKFMGDSKWTNFFVTDQLNTFKDERGNLYFFNSYTEGTWQAEDNGWFVNIRKVSSELRY